MNEKNGRELEGTTETSPSYSEAEAMPVSQEFQGWRRKTTWFLSGQAVSLFGSSLVQYAIVWHITLTTHSGPMLTISALAAFLPQVLISLFAGVWADRYNRKRLIITADALIATSTLILAVVFLMGYKSLWLLFLITAIRSFGAGVHTPAVGALIPQITPPDKLAKVNGLNASIQSTIMLLSPAASGALLSLSTMEVIFFVDVFTAIIAIGMLLHIHIPTHSSAADAQSESQIANLKAGVMYAGKHTFVRSLMIFYAICFVLATPVAFLTPLMIARTFGDEVWRLTANEIVFFAGSILGGLVFTVWGGFRNRIHTFAISCALFGVLTIAMGFSSTFIVYLVFMTLLGLGMPFFGTPVTVALQETVEPAMLGRVFSLIQIVSSTAMPFGMVVFGPLANLVRVESLLVVTGVMLSALSVSAFYNRGLKASEEPVCEQGGR